MCHRCVLSSFDWRVLLACAKRAPELTRGYLTLEQNPDTTMVPNMFDGSSWMGGVTRADHDGSLPQTIAALGGKVWCPYFKDLTQGCFGKGTGLGIGGQCLDRQHLRRYQPYGRHGCQRDHFRLSGTGAERSCAIRRRLNLHTVAATKFVVL